MFYSYYDNVTKEYLGTISSELPEDRQGQSYAEMDSVLPRQYGSAFVFVDGSFIEIEDHRKFNAMGEESFGTPYWLPEDTWESEPRFMETFGPLPEDALLERPEKPKTEEEIFEEELEEIRLLREEECFSIVDRSQLWYSKNVDTPEKQAELDTWYEAWLHVTDEKPYIIPERPIWLNPKN